MHSRGNGHHFAASPRRFGTLVTYKQTAFQRRFIVAVTDGTTCLA